MKGYYERRFLNTKRAGHGGAYVLIDHEADHNFADLKISDCDRVVSLSIDLSDETEKANSLQKVQTLIDVLIDYAEWLAEKDPE